MTGSEYMVERRNFEYWSSAWPITFKIWKRKSVTDFRNRAFAAFQLDTSEQGYSPDPSSRVGSGIQTSHVLHASSDRDHTKLYSWNQTFVREGGRFWTRAYIQVVPMEWIMHGDYRSVAIPHSYVHYQSARCSPQPLSNTQWNSIVICHT